MNELDTHSRTAVRDLLAWRRDVRRFSRDPVARELVIELLTAAQLSPSVGNAQPWRFVLVDDARRRAAVRASFVTENERAALLQADERQAHYRSLKLAGLDDAPVHLAVFCDHAVSQGHTLGRLTMPETLDYSVVCAIHALWLLTRVEGLGLGWISILDPEAVTRALDVPPAWKLIAYLCIGFPAEAHLDPELVRHDWQPRIDPAANIVTR